MKTELVTLPGKVRFYSQTMPLPPVTHAVFDGSPLTAFHPVSESTVREMLTKTAIRTCQLDSLLSFTSVINDSLLTGIFPSVFKSAVFRPLLKIPTLDTENVTNLCPTRPSFPRSPKRLSSFYYPNILKVIISFTPFSLPIARARAPKLPFLY